MYYHSIIRRPLYLTALLEYLMDGDYSIRNFSGTAQNGPTII